jgi:DNA-damage-inducible protein D
MENANLIPFEGHEIRKTWHNEEWLSAIDVIGFLTESKDPSNYWTMLKKRDSQLSTICGKLKFLAPDGKMRSTDCARWGRC